jgi:hypothetical protein
LFIHITYSSPSSEILYPNASGDSTQLIVVGNATNWGAEVSDDSDTSYCKSELDDIGQLDLYNIQDTSIPIGSTINNVTVQLKAKSTSITYKAFCYIALKKSGGSIQYSDEILISTTTYTTYNNAWTNITQSDLNSLQIGVQIISGENSRLGIYWAGRSTQIYAIIYYTIPSKTWQSVLSWNFDLLTRQYNNITWYYDLITKNWNGITWYITLITKQWNNSIWYFNLLSTQWNNITVWFFFLIQEDDDIIILLLLGSFISIILGLVLYGKSKS